MNRESLQHLQVERHMKTLITFKNETITFLLKELNEIKQNISFSTSFLKDFRLLKFLICTAKESKEP